MASLSTVTRRSRRHGHAKRHRRSVLSSRSDGPHRRRQVQKQTSCKAKKCFDHYQQRGRHHLPNVSDDAPVGFSGSRFSILETVDISSSPLHMDPPQCDFTFKKRHPGFGASNRSPQSNSARRPEIADGPVQPTSEDVALDLNHSIVPTAPLPDLELPLPTSYSLDSEHTNLQAEIALLNDVVIPSPLLYHREICGELLGVDRGEDVLSKDTLNLACGSDPLDTDVSVESLRLGSPLQPSGDGFKHPSFDLDRLNALGDEDFPAVDDPVFYRRSRAYLTYSPRGSGRCAVQGTPPLGNSILATTGTLRKRQTHVYPEDFGPTPPSTPPPSTWTPARPLASRIEQPHSTAAAIVGGYDSLAANNRTEMNVDVALPSLRLYPLSGASVEKLDYEYGEREISPRIFPHYARAQEVSVQGNDSCDVLMDSFRTASDGEATHNPVPEFQAKFQSREEAGEGVRTSNDKLDSHYDRRANAKTYSLHVGEQIRLREGPEFSPIQSSFAETTDMSRATTTTGSDLSVTYPILSQPILQPLAASAPPSLSLARPDSTHHESPMAPGVDFVEMEACPTKGCMALLLLASTERKPDKEGPEHKKFNSPRHQLRVPFWEIATGAADAGIVIIATVHRGTRADVYAGDGDDCDGSGRLDQIAKNKNWSALSSAKGKRDPALHMQDVIEMAAARVAEELGFELEHEEGCQLGVGFKHDKGASGAPVKAGIRPPNNSSTRETGSEDVSRMVMQVEGEVEGDVADDGSEGDWVGEGEGAEFWV